MERKAMNMKKPAHPAMKKPVSRATLLEYLLSDFIEVGHAFAAGIKDGTRPLTTKETRLYNEVRARLRELITALTNDLAREHGAA